jgi:hypothetical protein
MKVVIIGALMCALFVGCGRLSTQASTTTKVESAVRGLHDFSGKPVLVIGKCVKKTRSEKHELGGVIFYDSKMYLKNAKVYVDGKLDRTIEEAEVIICRSPECKQPHQPKTRILHGVSVGEIARVRGEAMEVTCPRHNPEQVCLTVQRYIIFATRITEQN